MLASLAVLAAAAALPASLVRLGPDEHAQVSATTGNDEHDGLPAQDGTSASEQDDDLDEGQDGLDGVVAVIEIQTHTFVPSFASALWPMREARSPRTPHSDDTLRPPIAS